MSYQRGSLVEVRRKAGAMWMLRYRRESAGGQRTEHRLPVGLLSDFPTEKAAWREVERQGLLTRINAAPEPEHCSFDALMQHYLRVDFGPDALRPKAEGTTLNMNHIVRDYLLPQFGGQAADVIKPLVIQKWLRALHEEKGLSWPTVSKIRGVMLRAYKTGQ